MEKEKGFHDFTLHQKTINKNGSTINCFSYLNKNTLSNQLMRQNPHENVLRNEYISALRILTTLAYIVIPNTHSSYKFNKKNAISKNVSSFGVLQWYIISLLLLSTCFFITPGNASHVTGQSKSLSRARMAARPNPLMHKDRKKCEPIEVPLCQGIGYNYTAMALSPANFFRQPDANKAVEEFRPLFQENCAEEMRLLTCLVYVPVCMPGYSKFLPPCRFICEAARRGCEPLIMKYDYKWPDLFRCDRFPVYTKGNPMCMHFNRTKPESPVIPRDVARPPKFDGNLGPKSPSKDEIPTRSPGAGAECKCACQSPMVTIKEKKNPLYDKISTGGIHNCAIPCRTPYFPPEKIEFAEVWITAWAIMCFIVTLATVSTFLIDTDRFKYPERPIIFLSTCYMFVSIGFLIRVVAGHEAVACSWHSDHVLYRTTGPFLCSAVFLLVYFFGMAASLWWVILSLTWFLAAGLKWGSEAITSYSQYFHAAAWLIPALKSIMVLAMSSVDGDALSGICYVGNQDTNSLRGFVLAPLVVYLGLGGLFLLLGFINLFRVRDSIKKVGKKTDTLDKHMGRIGLFSLLYMVPSAALVACHFYEQQYREQWAYAYNCKARERFGCRSVIPAKPEFAVYIVKYSMTLLIGVTNGVWICSGKTIKSWQKFYSGSYQCICGHAGFTSWIRRKEKDSDVESSDTAVVTSSTGKSSSAESVITRDGAFPVKTPGYERTSREETSIGRNHSSSGGSSKRSYDKVGRNSENLGTITHSRSRTNTSSSNEKYCYQTTDLKRGNREQTEEHINLIKSSSIHHSSCDEDTCSLPFPHACHAVRSNSAALRHSSSHFRGYPSGEKEIHTYVDRISPAASFEADGTVSRVQHIHHHHHHHHPSGSANCTCGCHKQRRLQKHRHSPHSREKDFYYMENQRKFRTTPPPITHKSPRQ